MVILNGIIKENIRLIEKEEQNHKIDKDHVEVVWTAFLKVAGVEDFDGVPNTSDPEHPDVMAFLFMYSMESFLFDRLNQSC